MKAVIEKYAGLEFSYPLDCCQFVGECVETITGRNPADEFEYNSMTGAMRHIQRFGSLRKLLTHVFGREQPSGEVALLELNGRETAAIVWRGRLVARTPGGLMDYPLAAATCFWKVR